MASTNELFVEENLTGITIDDLSMTNTLNITNGTAIEGLTIEDVSNISIISSVPSGYYISICNEGRIEKDEIKKDFLLSHVPATTTRGMYRDYSNPEHYKLDLAILVEII